MQRPSFRSISFVIFLLLMLSLLLNVYEIKQNRLLSQRLLLEINKIREMEALLTTEKKVRNELDIQFYEIIAALKDNDIPRLKDMINDNIHINGNELIIEYDNGAKDSLIILPIGEKNFIQEKDEPSLFIPREGYYFRQRYFFLENDDTKFSTAYEIRTQIKDTLDICYVDFILVSGQWKLSGIGIDIG